jgi:hypothetical protein
MAQSLTGILHLPNLKGPYFGCLPESWRAVSRVMGTRYETYSATVGSEMSELKAAAEPRLISDRRQQMRPTKNNAGIGTWSVGWI